MSTQIIVSDALLNHLVEQFPDSIPAYRADQTPDYLTRLQGQQEVVRYLQRLKEDQEENVFRR